MGYRKVIVLIASLLLLFAGLVAQGDGEFVIGYSVEGRKIVGSRVGNGADFALVVTAGIHGDEGTTTLLARALAGYFAEAPERVPPGASIYFLSALNPDGLAAGQRTNANGIDLNRNFPTPDWSPNAYSASAMRRGAGGSAPGSEPEVRALCAWLLSAAKPSARNILIINYHSLYAPGGLVMPGYGDTRKPGAVSLAAAKRSAHVAGYGFLPMWSSPVPLTGESIHWAEANGMPSVDIELPDRKDPRSVPVGKPETTLDTQIRVIGELLAWFCP
jgi:hypothetical protein